MEGKNDDPQEQHTNDKPKHRQDGAVCVVSESLVPVVLSSLSFKIEAVIQRNGFSLSPVVRYDRWL